MEGPRLDGSKLDLAIQVAAELHRGQTRDGEVPLPYVTHPLEVLSNLRYIGEVTEEDSLVAATLHDLLEMTEICSSEILEWFGPKVQGLVMELTRTEPTPDEIAGKNRDEVWEMRSDYLLYDIARMSAAAQAIKLADRLANLREAKRMKGDRKLERYYEQTQRILKVIPRVVNRRLWDAIRTELA